MICNNCGKENKSKQTKCTHCGNELSSVNENLLNKDILANKKFIQQQNHLIKYFNLSLFLTFVLSLMFTFASYLTKDGLQIAFIVISYIFLISFFVLLIIKSKKIKKLNNNKIDNKDS